MATYAFETITAEQARSILAGDYLTFSGSPASHTTVIFSPLDLTVPAHISVTHDGRTVLFGTELADLSLRGAIEFADHSRLLIGNDQRNILTGLDGADALYGGAGDDTLHGGAGDDFLQGNSGNDLIDGEAGRNTLYGGQGDDRIVISGATGSWAQGNMGADTISGGAGNDTLYGGQGDDQLRGGEGHDWVIGDLGNDDIRGGGDDILLGGAGDDTLESQGGGDYLYGDEGDDLLIVSGSSGGELVMVDGDDGRDTIVLAGQGKSVAYGGAGGDRFEIVARGVPASAAAWDEIRDWTGGSDTLHFAQVSIYDAAILPRAYSEFVATDYAQAVAIANEHISATGAIYVVAQVGGDLYVFAETDGDPADGADAGIMIAGRTLADIAYSDFV